MTETAAAPSAAFPASPADIDEAWLTSVLQGSGTIGPDARVTGFSSEQIGVGVGILGLLWRMHLQYEPAGAGPASAVLKLPHTMAESRHIADAFRFYLREVRFYEQVGHRTPLLTPDLYHAAYDDDTGDFVLLIEEITGRAVHDQLAGCPPEHAEVAVRELAAHHATWWETPELKAMDWATRVCDPPNPQALVPALRASWPIVESQFGHLLTGLMREAGRRFPDVVVPLMEQLSEPPITLVHGDYRLDNLFFTDIAGQPPVAAIDWQICGRGRGAYDVAYFLSQSLVSEERKANEAAIVRAYHDTLVDRGVAGYSFDDCWEDYRRATLFVAVYPLNAGSVDLVNERAVELMTVMLSRSVAAILDLDALELLPS